MSDQDVLRLHSGDELLPKGPHRLTEAEVQASQRGRMLQAMTDAVGEKGYADAVVADVIRRARVSRAAFYEQFANKEDCFLAAYDIASRMHLEQVLAAAGREDHWFKQLRAGLETYLASLAASPAFARTFLLEVMAGGPRLLEQRSLVLERYVSLLRTLHDGARAEDAGIGEVGDHALFALVGGANELAAETVRAGRPGELSGLAPTLVEFALAVMVGREHSARLTGSR
jgi:AcrR family transcriptional regulator